MQSEFAQAFDQMLQQHHINAFDAVVIIRGGGAKLDLHQLNEYSIAKQITQLPLPVLTGIGHERDNTVLDEVAHSRFDTPSKVVHFITQQIIGQATQAKQNWQNINQSAKNDLLNFERLVENLWRQIEQSSIQQVHQWQQLIGLNIQQVQQQSYHQLTQEKQNLKWLNQQVDQLIKQHLTLAKQQLKQVDQQINQSALVGLRFKQQQLRDWMALILNAGPQVQIQRGFAVVSNIHGETLTTKKSAVKEQNLRITFKDGSLEVAVKHD